MVNERTVVQARPLDPDDAEALTAIDRSDAARTGRTPVLSRGALAFYERSGHAFTAWRDGTPQGFALAQAVWDGAQATVRLATVALADASDHEVRAALLEAVTKSAYDAAVYALAADVPDTDPEARALFEAAGWRPLAARPYRRTLGSRGTP